MNAPSPASTIVKELIMATGILMFTAAAVLLLPSWYAPLSGPQLIAAATVVFACAYAIRLAHPALGIVAATLLFLLTSFVVRPLPSFVPIHAAAIFLLLHSLSWKISTPTLTGVRFVAAAIWISNALSWIHGHGFPAKITIAFEGVFVLGMAVAVRLVYGSWRTILVPISAVAVTLLYPLHALSHQASPGLVALAVSALFFAIAAMVACTKLRWPDTRRSE